MRASVRAPVVAAVLLLLTPVSSVAEWQFTPFVGYTFKGSTTIVDFEGGAARRHWHLGGAVGVVGDGPLGVEALFLYIPGFFQNPEDTRVEARVTSSRAHALMGNAVLAAPRAWTQYGLRPYLSGGIGRLHVFRNDILNVVPVSLNLLGMNVGGGGIGFISDRVGLRFDLRYFRKIHGPSVEDLEIPVSGFDPIRLRFWTTSVGVVIRY